MAGVVTCDECGAVIGGRCVTFSQPGQAVKRYHPHCYRPPNYERPEWHPRAVMVEEWDAAHG